MIARVSGARAVRIHGRSVLPLVPRDGPVYVLLVGEAPGPRGADKSGIPFFGDAAGRHLYHALARMGAMLLPPEIDAMEWDGTVFAARGIRPVPVGVALGNAFDRCPTDNGTSFRAPTRSELEGPDNVARISSELLLLAERGLRGVVTMGRVATKTLDFVLRATPMDALVRRALPHPSAQGLLSMAPDRGRGARMADLQLAWQLKLREAVVDAGYPPELVTKSS